MDKLQTGHSGEARGDFVVLSLMADAPEDVRSRAKVAMAMIDSGGLSNLPAIIKAARALPPAPPGGDASADSTPAGEPDSQTPQAGAAQ